MRYLFQCKECESFCERVFLASEWDKYISKDSKLKRAKCDECGKSSLYLFIGEAPPVMGGTSGYESMEKFWSKNPDLVRKHKEQMEQDNQRHKNFKNDAIKRQKAGEQIGPLRKDQRDDN